MSFWGKENLLKLSKKSLGANCDWLRDIQQEAVLRFLDRGFPQQKEEAWKYTSTKCIEKKSFDYFPAQKNNHVKPEFKFDAYHLVIVDGHFVPELSDSCRDKSRLVHSNILPDSVLILPLQDALLSHSKKIKQAISDLDRFFSANPFVLLNTALLSGGLWIQIKSNTQLEKPLHILHLKTKHSQDCMFHPAYFVCVEENAQAVIVEEFKSTDEVSLFENIAMHIQLGKRASLAHYKLQMESREAAHLHHLLVNQHERSHFERYHIDSGAKLSRQEILVQLKEAHADCQLNGLYAAQDHQHMDNQVRVEHCVSHGKSQQLYKGLADDQAHAVFNGKILVMPHAQKINAHQVNKNLLLSDEAEIDTKPELEIYADDVQCSHGATIGQLDETALFYLQSRGIELLEAQNLLKQAFVFEIIDRMPLEALRNDLSMLQSPFFKEHKT